ncbi:MAG TPA: hypothetical protein H9774_08000 [Candidatus Desulfovibrio gallistercoris]|nr:hypothetical protein [Candidatus Desulfovibrio gallistercoris]
MNAARKPRGAEYFAAMRAAEAHLPSLRELSAAHLPRSVQHIAGRIGLPATLRLVENFGGLTLRLPVGARAQGRALLDELARCIGEEAARTLAAMYAVYPLYVPNCKPALLRARNALLLGDRRELARQGLSERQIAQCLALRYGLSERTVWDIFKKPLAPAPQQASLLDTA